jgi:Reverse transcriptase (RNA-dependent DNA polymerase)
VDALEEVIQLVWTSETLPESWSKGVLRPVYKQGDKLDCTNYRGFCLLNVAYKVFAKILYDRLLPYTNAVVQHYQAGFQSGKSTTDQLFAERQIFEKGNEYNILTHHLFIDFKAAYDRAQLSYETNTSSGSNTEHCAELRENSERLF